MKSREEILNELYLTGYVDKYTRQKLVNREVPAEDAIQEVWLIVCQIPEERLQELYEARGIDSVRQFVGGIICRTVCSKSSGFHYTYVKKDTNNIMIRRTNDRRTKFDEEKGWQ